MVKRWARVFVVICAMMLAISTMATSEEPIPSDPVWDLVSALPDTPTEDQERVFLDKLFELSSLRDVSYAKDAGVPWVQRAS